jgi:dipeptidase E
MKLYLSSYKIGNRADKLMEMVAGNTKTAYIPNATDASDNPERSKEHILNDINELKALGLDVEILDLREYFDKPNDLTAKLREYCVIWVCGGNTFVLRQAMKLSGFDIILQSWWVSRVNMVYGGYSAGVCVLGPSLQGIHLADKPEAQPYGSHDTLWDGLNILPYCVAPHYRSDHFESEMIEQCVDYYIEHKILFKALHDGDVIIVE